MTTYNPPNYQNNPAGAIPVYITSGPTTAVPSIPVYVTSFPGYIVGLTGGNSTLAVAAANSVAIRTALSLGGPWAIPGNLGDVYINETVEVHGNSSFVIGAGTRLKRMPGVIFFHMVRNYHAQNGVDMSLTTISGGVATINEPGCPWAVGDVIYVEGTQGNTTLNGFQTVLSVTPGVSWTFAASGSNPTNPSTQLAFTSRANQVAGSNFTRASNVVTVTETGHTRCPGDSVYIGANQLTSTNSFGGAYEITGATAGVSWTYANTGANETPTGTAQVLGDRNIETVLDLDGNYANLTYQQWGAHLSHWGNLSKMSLTIRDARNGTGGRVSNAYNVRDFYVPLARASILCSVLLQFDSYCSRVTVSLADGQNLGDDTVAWGVTNSSGPFAQTAQPTGPGAMGTLTVDSIKGDSLTGLLKLYAYTGYDLGNIIVNSITGTGPVTIGDSSTGVGGGSITSLTIQDCNNVPLTNGNGINLGGAAFSTMGIVRIGKFVDNATTAGTTGASIAIGAPFNTVVIDQYVSAVARTGYGILSQSTGTTLQINSMQAVIGSAGSIILAAGSSGIVNNLILNDISASGNGNLFYEQTGGYFPSVYINGAKLTNLARVLGCNSAGFTHNYYVNGLELLSNTGSLFNSAVSGTYNIYATNVNGASIANNLIQCNATGASIRFVGKNIKAPSGQWCLFSGSTTISIDCKEFAIPLGATPTSTAPSQLVPLAGDQVTNTTAGALGVWGRPGANTSWVLLY